MSQRTPMTPAGKVRMEKELDRLRKVERPAIIAAIEEAREHGDLKENAEYHAAKERQGMLEARIREYEAKISSAEVIDPTKMSGDIARFGATVTVLDLDTDEKVTYTIVGEDESDYQRNLINFRAPLARAIMGHEADEIVEVKLEKGSRKLEILNVEWLEIKL